MQFKVHFMPAFLATKKISPSSLCLCHEQETQFCPSVLMRVTMWLTHQNWHALKAWPSELEREWRFSHEQGMQKSSFHGHCHWHGP
jgi:hypothetical protein